jgi:hypothetical protein
MEIKDRKLNVLYRKIENLEEQVKDKEAQMQTLKSKINVINNTVSSNQSDDRLTENSISDGDPNMVKDEFNANLQELREMNEKKDREIMEYQVGSPRPVLAFAVSLNLLSVSPDRMKYSISEMKSTF